MKVKFKRNGSARGQIIVAGTPASVVKIETTNTEPVRKFVVVVPVYIIGEKGPIHFGEYPKLDDPELWVRVDPDAIEYGG